MPKSPPRPRATTLLRQLALDPRHIPVERQNLLVGQGLAGGDAELAVVVVDGALEGLEPARGDVALPRLDQCRDVLGDDRVERRDVDHPVLDAAPDVARL